MFTIDVKWSGDQPRLTWELQLHLQLKNKYADNRTSVFHFGLSPLSISITVYIHVHCNAEVPRLCHGEAGEEVQSTACGVKLCNKCVHVACGPNGITGSTDKLLGYWRPTTGWPKGLAMQDPGHTVCTLHYVHTRRCVWI